MIKKKHMQFEGGGVETRELNLKCQLTLIHYLLIVISNVGDNISHLPPLILKM